MAASTLVFPVPTAARANRAWQVLPITNTVEVKEPEAYPGVASRAKKPLPRLVKCIETRDVPLPRKVSREQGRALETLAHAIEYLTDQGLMPGVEQGVLEARIGDMQAIHMLKRHSRELYTSLPVRRPFWKRFMGSAPLARPVVVFPV